MKVFSALALIASAAIATVQAQEDTANPLDALARTEYPDEWHMKPIRVVHARVQGDTPVLQGTRFVSKYGEGLEGGYRAGMDTVNTASVDGALMYVQAEGINVNSRAANERCRRKHSMQHIVFYEIMIAQTNETIAQFQDTWATPEYGRMIPMDGGRCTPVRGETGELPVECYQYNGENKQPNLGPFIGGESKETDARAPYPGNYWFSFPNSCPTQVWGPDKTEECRAATRKGLCPIDKAPDGVECTFAYNILGWVPIDDVVGITKMSCPSGAPCTSFKEWCESNPNNVEFDGQGGLPFWNEPWNKEANAQRAQAVLDAYNELLATKSSPQVNDTEVANFKPLPTPEALASINPPCYESVKSCGQGNGCKRVGHAQLCRRCQPGEGCPMPPPGFTFPDLEKAPTPLDEEELMTASSKLDDGMTPVSSSSGSDYESEDVIDGGDTNGKGDVDKDNTAKDGEERKEGSSGNRAAFAMVLAIPSALVTLLF